MTLLQTLRIPQATCAALALAAVVMGAPQDEAPDGAPTAPPSPYAVRDAVFTAGAQARLPVRVVQGRLVVTCDLSTARRRLPANLFLDLESPSTLELHNQAAAGLQAENGDGSTIPITVHLPGLEFRVQRRQLGDDPYLDRFTKWHSIELGETAVVGTIGGRLFADFHVTLDLPAGEVVLEPRAALGAPSRLDQLPSGTEELRIEVRDGLVWLPAQVGPDGLGGAFALGTGAYDSTLDAALAADLGFPAGDVTPVRVGSFDLAERVALRPAEVPYVHPDGALGLFGLGLLEDFRLEVDRVNARAWLTPVRPPAYPASDLAYFQATWDDWGPRDDAAALEAYLTAWPEERLSPEAAGALFELRLLEGAGAEAMTTAITWADDTTPDDLRATAALERMDLAASYGRPDVLVLAAGPGVDGGRDDRYPNAVHEVHAKAGQARLELGDDHEAWRHLLAAAFGLPDDGMVKLGLGRFYERDAERFDEPDRKRGRLRRAFSAYVQAAIHADSGPEAIEALARVQARLDDGAVLSVDEIERRIAGKVRNFGSATTFEDTAETTTGKVVLVEFFTNAFYGTEERGGAIGGALAQEGLLQHFPEDNVAFLSYHLPVPAHDPLTNQLALDRAAALGVGQPDVQVIDGVGRQPGAGKWRDAEAIYARTKTAIARALLVEPEFELDLDARLVQDGPGAGRVEGTVHVEGPGYDEDGEPLVAVQVVLAERKVVYPGGTGVVIHRMVARAELTGATGGIPFLSEDDADAYDFGADLEGIRLDNEATVDRLIDEGAGPVRRLSTGLDPTQLVVVAFLRDLATGQVHQALVLEPEGVAALREERP